MLRDEGGYEFKRSVVEAIFSMARYVQGSKEAALSHLCEFIEDCEFTKLNVRILHLLGAEGPHMPEPHKYIRFIYNRVILENAIVRAAAVNSLAKFGLHNAQLTDRIRVLLRRCLEDVDDEVRDRATLALRTLEPTTLPLALEDVPNLKLLEEGLQAYMGTPEAAPAPFDYDSVPRTANEPDEPAEAAVSMAPAPSAAAPVAPALSDAVDASAAYAAQLAAVPEFASYGAPLTTSPLTAPVPLTETEMEYVVTASKHVFPAHVVLQYHVTNTLAESVLELSLIHI